MKRIAAIAAIAACAASSAARASPSCAQPAGSANLIVNCGFETGDLTGWTIGGAAAALAQTNLYGVDAYNPYEGTYGAFVGVQGAALGTSGGTAGALELSQSFALQGAGSYVLTFFLLQDTPVLSGYTNFFAAAFDGSVLFSETAAPVSGYTQYTYNLMAGAGTNTLAFYFQNDAGYWNLDDVTLQQIPAPAGPGLFGLGAALLALARRAARKRAAA